MDDNKRKDELQDKFTPKKVRSIKVSDSMIRLGHVKRGLRVRECNTWLQFVECDNDGYRKLIRSNNCRDRFCSLCNWRRSRLLTGQLLKMFHVIQSREKLRYIFLGLSVRNPDGEDLSDVIGRMEKGFNRLFKYKEVDNAVVGYVRALEITYKKKNDTYHPHFHVLIGVRPKYFQSSSGQYINQARWTSLWQKAAKLDYKPIVDIEAVKPKKFGQMVEGAVCETVKYSVKDSDYVLETEEETDKVLGVLMCSLKNRRMLGFGKMFKKVRAELAQPDPESDEADLVGKEEGGCNCPICNSTLRETLYKWDFYNVRYMRMDDVV